MICLRTFFTPALYCHLPAVQIGGTALSWPAESMSEPKPDPSLAFVVSFFGGIQYSLIITNHVASIASYIVRSLLAIDVLYKSV